MNNEKISEQWAQVGKLLAQPLSGFYNNGKLVRINWKQLLFLTFAAHYYDRATTNKIISHLSPVKTANAEVSKQDYLQPIYTLNVLNPFKLLYSVLNIFRVAMPIVIDKALLRAKMDPTNRASVITKNIVTFPINLLTFATNCLTHSDRIAGALYASFQIGRKWLANKFAGRVVKLEKEEDLLLRNKTSKTEEIELASTACAMKKLHISPQMVARTTRPRAMAKPARVNTNVVRGYHIGGEIVVSMRSRMRC